MLVYLVLNNNKFINASKTNTTNVVFVIKPLMGKRWGGILQRLFDRTGGDDASDDATDERTERRGGISGRVARDEVLAEPAETLRAGIEQRVLNAEGQSSARMQSISLRSKSNNIACKFNI